MKRDNIVSKIEEKDLEQFFCADIILPFIKMKGNLHTNEIVVLMCVLHKKLNLG